MLPRVIPFSLYPSGANTVVLAVGDCRVQDVMYAIEAHEGGAKGDHGANGEDDEARTLELQNG